MFGYRPREVDAEIDGLDAALAERSAGLETAAHELEASRGRVDELELVSERLSDLVVERDRQLREARAQIDQQRTLTDRAMRSVMVLAYALERVSAEADRGADSEEADRGRDSGAPDGVGEVPPAQDAGAAPPRVAEDVFVGSVELEVGPLSDFAQLVGFEDAAGGIDATKEIAVKRFASGRATIEMSLSEPVELLRELEERSPFEFTVRDLRADRVVIDVDGE